MNNQDARPFVDLKKDAEEFRAKFDEDIAECIDFLDSKITALICDPDSLGSKCIRPNAAAEFSRAKYDIFISVKKLVTQKEKEWTDYISEMKKLFLENVEIFLAGTKLEVTLPSAEYQSSFGPRKSPGNRKSTSVTSSFMNTLTKSITGLSASRQNQEVSNKFFEEKSNVEDEVHFNRRVRYATKLPPFSMSKPSYHKDSSSADSEDETVGGKGTTEIAMDIVLDHATSKSSSKSRNSSSSDLNTSRSSSRLRNSLNKSDLNTSDDENYTSNSKENAIAEEAELSKVLVSSKGRRGRQAAKSEVHNSTANENHTSSSNKNAVAEEADLTKISVPPKGRRGRLAAKKKVDNSAANENYTSNADENAVDEAEIEKVSISSKGRRGRPAPKKKVDDFEAVIQTTNDSDENMIVEEPEKISNHVPPKNRRGRPAARSTIDSATVLLPDNQIVEDTKTTDKKEHYETKVAKVPARGRRAAKAMMEEGTFEEEKTKVAKAPARGRRAAKAMMEEGTFEEGKTMGVKAPARGQRGAKTMIEEETSEEDILGPLPTNPAPRRKTLFSNSRNALESDIVPGISVTNKSKRKTMSAVSEFEAGAPSKRLKVSNRKEVSSQEKDDAANDNLLESGENYSDWMPLKSIDGKIPTRPAIYELKVWRAKKPAYIGECESLRQKLTLYKLRQNSGHKHLDKFIDRNYNDIQVRFEVIESLSNAKEEVKNRVKEFVAQHKTTPAYN